MLPVPKVLIVDGQYFWDSDPCPRDARGLCLECGQPKDVGHLGICSWSIMNGGTLEGRNPRVSCEK